MFTMTSAHQFALSEARRTMRLCAAKSSDKEFQTRMYKLQSLLSHIEQNVAIQIAENEYHFLRNGDN